MRLFTIGPVQLFKSTLEIRNSQIPYFRSSSFSEKLENCDLILKYLIDTSINSKIMYLTCSGTGAMSATVANFFDKNDKILIINAGWFGQRFCDIADSLNIDFDEIKVPFGKDLLEEDLNKYNNRSYKAVLVTAHETSSGLLNDLKMISKFTKKNNYMLVVDAITSFLCDEFSMKLFNIDIAIISSHKGLCISPGMSMVVCNEDSLNKLNTDQKDIYFNFNYYLENIKRFQTPFTPAVGIVCELEDILIKIKNIGIENWINGIKTKAEKFRKGLDKRISLPEHQLSNAITPIIFNSNCANVINTNLEKKYSMIANPCSGSNAHNMLRVAHIGNLSNTDFDDLNEYITKELNLI
jgi:aspartate aminotransferase-like enzyme